MPRVKEEVHKAPTRVTVDAIRNAFETNNYTGMTGYQKLLMNPAHRLCRFKMESPYVLLCYVCSNVNIQMASCGICAKQSVAKLH